MKSEEQCVAKEEAEITSLISANGRWTDDEHRRFEEGLIKFGKNWNSVSAYVGTRKSD